MIYIKRDPALIPEKILKVAERAREELEALPAAERADFIDKKSHIWRSFARYLSKMSYGKCWYSEANDPQSFFDVDHFRPKKEAMRSLTEKDDGYPWMAFSWDNFRYSAGRSNRRSTDEVTDKVVGKGSWFPLFDGSPKACWDNRCELTESIVLIDPAVKSDVDLIDIDDAGHACASLICIGALKTERVARSIELYGLNLGNLISARKKAMRDITDHYDNLMDLITGGNDMAAVERIREQMRRATQSDSPYSLAARAELYRRPSGARFCAQPEDQPA